MGMKFRPRSFVMGWQGELLCGTAFTVSESVHCTKVPAWPSGGSLWFLCWGTGINSKSKQEKPDPVLGILSQETKLHFKACIACSIERHSSWGPRYTPACPQVIVIVLDNLLIRTSCVKCWTWLKRFLVWCKLVWSPLRQALLPMFI